MTTFLFHMEDHDPPPMTMAQEAERWAASLEERTRPFIDGDADLFDDDDERTHELPDAYDVGTVLRVLCYGGGPAGGVEFDVTREGDDFTAARVWHQDWFEPKGYAPLDDDVAQVLWDYWGLEVARR